MSTKEGCGPSRVRLWADPHVMGLNGPNPLVTSQAIPGQKFQNTAHALPKPTCDMPGRAVVPKLNITQFSILCRVVLGRAVMPKPNFTQFCVLCRVGPGRRA